MLARMTNPVRIWISGAIAVALLGGAFGLVRSGAWDQWRAGRYAKRAQVLLDAGAREAARAGCVRALQLDPKCADAIRTMINAIPANDDRNEIVLRSKLADLDPNDQANLQRLALVSISTKSLRVASKAIADLTRKLGECREVFELRGRLYAAEGDLEKAGIQARELIQRDPANPVGRLILALSQVLTGPAEALDHAERELRELSQSKTLGIEALRGLRQAAIRRGDNGHALEISTKLVAEPTANFADWLIHAEQLVRAQPERVDPVLADLTARAKDDDQAFGLIAAWLHASGHADLIEKWAKSNAAMQRHRVTSEMIRVVSFAKQGAWNRIVELLEKSAWEKLDFLRQAHLARAYRQQHSAFLSSSAWSAATKDALREPESTRKLADAVQSWPEWQDEYTDFLWTAQSRNPRNLLWALSDLMRHYEAAKDTASLLRVSEELLKANPASESAKNNCAFYSLLLNASPDRAGRFATELFNAHPSDPSIVSTYALSLLRQNRAAQALAVLQKLPAAAQNSPAIAVYLALAQKGAGQTDAALKTARNIKKGALLREEAELLTAESLLPAR